ncbi:MAG: [protein-PII] uridylyltransferase [Bacteroidetes bacterium]|nr:[protein-PII] uridylyltransferase [Bacteroidota bacterium]
MQSLQQYGEQIFNPFDTGFLMVRHLANQFGKDLVKAYRQIPELDGTALIALGGFGRREMCPNSDVDVLILVPDGMDKTRLENGIRALFNPLWNHGLKIGHAVRTLAEAQQAMTMDLETLTTSLDSRFLDGNAGLATRFDESIDRFLNTNKNQTFLYELVKNYNTSLAQYGGSVNLLEPNVKKSPGTLRDVHFLGWMVLLTSEGQRLFARRSTDDETQTERVLLRLYKLGMIDETQYRHVFEATDFMLKTRFALHLADQRSTDQLGFNQQPAVAGRLGLRGEDNKELCEALMRKYYLHARKIFRLSRTFIQQTEEFCRPPYSDLDEQLDGGFTIRNNRIHWGRVSQESSILAEFTRAPWLQMMAFYYQADYGFPFSDMLRSAITQSYELITEEFQANPRVVHLFRKILVAKNCSYALKNMLELGVLNRFIPEYGPLVGLYQRNAYHWYTADYHTLVAIEKLEQSVKRYPAVHRVRQQLERQELLILSIIFHDIGKGFDIANHSIVGMDVAQQVMARWDYPQEEINLVCFMVEQHLTMELYAFRRNYHDPETLQSFINLFPDEEYLDILFCLTYSDLSAVNPTVWTEWKGMMLEELYRITRRAITSTSEKDGGQVLKESKDQKVESMIRHQTDPAVLAHIREFNHHNDYWLAFRPDEIARHASARKNGHKVHVDVGLFDGYQEITVITEDQEGLLYKLCGVISSLDNSIFDARVFTSPGGQVIDRFRVFPIADAPADPAMLQSQLTDRLEAVLTRNEPVEGQVDKFRKKWKRRFKPASLFEPEVTVETSGEFLIFDVYAPDMLGLMYQITRTFSDLHLPIQQAKIATRLDGVNDTFYVYQRHLPGGHSPEEFCRSITDRIGLLVKDFSLT